MSNPIKEQYPLGFEGMDATLPTGVQMYKDVIRRDAEKKAARSAEAEQRRLKGLLGPDLVAKMQAYAKNMIRKYPKATPARIRRMVAKKFKITLR